MQVELLTAVITVIISSIVGPIALYLVQYYSNKKKKTDTIKESLDTNIVVTNKLEQLIDTYGADRVWIIQFHNGGTFYPTGKSIQKFSMVYEIVNNKTKSVQQNFQNIPISLFTRIINEVYEENMVCISDVETYTIHDTLSIKNSVEITENKSLYRFALKSLDNRLIGIIGLDYVQEKRELPDDTIQHLAFDISAIGGSLHQQLFAK